MSISLLAPAAVSCAQTGSWLEVRTPSFTIVTNSTEKDGRRTAQQFEQMRSVLRRVFPAADLDTPTPIMVMAVSDKRNLQALEPTEYLAKGQISIAGLFLASAERNYVLLWLAGSGRHPYAPIYHEYTHFVTSRTGQWMPLWLTEGLAQYYENTEILDNEVRLGEGIPGTLELLQHNALLPLPTLFSVDHHSPYYHEEDKASVFYAESWVLTHYLKTKDAKENTHLIDDYLALLRGNVDPVAAATQAFGDLDQLQTELRKYIVSDDHAYLPIDGSTGVDESSFMVRALSQVEADTMRADFLAHDHREADARKLLESILHDDPANVLALQTMGFAAFEQHNFDEARRWCEQAIKADGQSFFAQYCFGVATLQKGMTDAAAQASIESSLRTVIRLNPSFALGYDALGMSYALRGKRLDEAYQLLQTAVQLDPGTVEIRIDEAQVLMHMNRDKEAADVLDLALKMSHTPEQTAAVEMMQQTLRKFVAARAKAALGEDVITPRAAAGGQYPPGNPAASEARAIYSPQPDYTDEARQAKLQGVCVVSFIIGVDGKTSNIAVVKKLGMGLDQKAIEAVSKWRFEPSRKNGRPIPTHLTLSLTFKLVGEGNQKFFELSENARTGDPAAEFELAQAFLQGRGIPKDETQGLALLERAAQDGQPQAQFQMGERTYGDGNNSENYVAAYVWYALAQRGGIENAGNRVIDLEARMTQEQLSEARKRVESSTVPLFK